MFFGMFRCKSRTLLKTSSCHNFFGQTASDISSAHLVMPASSPSFDLVMRQKDGTRRWQGRVAAMLASLWAKQCFSQPDPVPWHVEILTKIASQGHFGTGLECSFLPTSSIYHGLVTHNSSLLRVPCLGPLWHAEMD